MPLDLSNTLSYYDWCRLRETQKAKWINVPYLKKFNEALNYLSNKYDGEIVYYTNRHKNLRYMSYGEGTPAFYLFKLVPTDYFVYRFPETAYWKHTDPDTDLFNYLKDKQANKYKQSDINIDFPFDYVLFVLQQIHLSLPILKQVSEWALDTKTNVVYKAHPMEQHNELVPMNRYTHLVKEANIDYLIKKAKAVWSRESGVGFQALLQNIPTAYFEKSIDYNYGPMAQFSTTPYEAAKNPHVPYNEIIRYFTWYYKAIAVDVSKPTFIETIEDRLFRYFIKKETERELLTVN
jgi:hypothetical protein